MQKILSVLQNNKKNIIINAVFIVIIVVFWLSTDIGDIKEYYVDRSESNNTFTFYVYGESQVLQRFMCNAEGINELEIPIDTQKDRYRGEFKVTLADEDSNLIQEWITDKGVLYEDNWIEYKLDEPLKKGETYNLIISATGLDLANAVEVTGTATLNTANKDLNVSYLYCYYNGESDGCVAFAAVKYHPNVFAIIAVVLVMVVLNVFIHYDSKGADITKYSFISILLLGLIMLVIFSPASGPDEDFHYNTSLALSNVLLGRDNISEVEQEYVFDYSKHVNKNENFIKVYTGLFNFGDIDDSITVIGAKERVWNLNYPAAHIISAVGMALGRGLRFNGVQVYMLARIFNLLAYAIMAQFAISTIPVKKELLYILAINPMALHQASQLTYDNITNGLCMVFFAYVLRLIYEKKYVKWSDVGKLTVMMLMYGPVKYIYCAHSLFILAVPTEKFRSKWDKVVKFVTMLIAVAILVVFTSKSYTASYVATTDDVLTNTVQTVIETEHVSDEEVNEVVYSEKYYISSDVLSNPIRFIKIGINTINKNAWYYLKTCFGTSLAGATSEVYEYVTYMYMICIILVLLGNDNKIYTEYIGKIGIIVGTILEMALVIAAGIIMTPYGSNIIQGLQGRYFIPCMLPLMYGLLNKKISIDIKYKTVLKMMVFIYIGIVFSTLGAIVY